MARPSLNQPGEPWWSDTHLGAAGYAFTRSPEAADLSMAAMTARGPADAPRARAKGLGAKGTRRSRGPSPHP